MNKRTAHITPAKLHLRGFQVTLLTLEKLYRTGICKIIWAHGPLFCYTPAEWTLRSHGLSEWGLQCCWSGLCERRNLRKALKAVKRFNW